ncbi:STAS domain-containing protein [Longimicrobium sp.]|uniref:STAS domain-containing protein n=1 Tax=Longimicrobium sp. TaxID=2029185 RepID=UPI002C603BCB|nr:STAS domain-containing protein [Longimicrobium sp.]HSU13243.1 STAS domain-containing protein [Longimicrobium sp.]
MPEVSAIQAVLAEDEARLLDDWMREQFAASNVRRDLMSDAELRQQSAEFLAVLRTAVQTGRLDSVAGPEWAPVRDVLSSISRSRALQGFSPSETARFVFSLKQPLFTRLREQVPPERLADEIWGASSILDALGLHTTEFYQKSREEVIARQQQELLELSTPVVKVWDGVVAVPLIGTLDSARTQVVMENLLGRIVENEASVAIIDITGVPTVDTLVAQHLIKTVAAARLMGAECIISGIRPQIAQTIVHLGVVLEDVTTKASLADAILLALRKTGFTVTRIQPRA